MYHQTSYYCRQLCTKCQKSGKRVDLTTIENEKMKNNGKKCANKQTLCEQTQDKASVKKKLSSNYKYN